MRYFIKGFLGLPILVVLSLVGSAKAQSSVELVSAKDNTLYETSLGDLSNGAGEHFFAGKNNTGNIRRALIYFDVAGNLPAGATVDSVYLTLHLSRTVSGSTSVELHRVLRDWGEAGSDAPFNEGGGAPSETGDATWLHAFFDADFWAAPGGDYSPVVSAEKVVADTGLYTWASTANLVSDVQLWLDSPGQNFGWMVIGDESISPSAKRFDTRENGVLAFRPRLRILYSTATALREQQQQKSLPRTLRLYQNHPNPFNPTTTIRIGLAQTEDVSLKVFDALGKEVAEITRGRFSAGEYEFQFDGASLPSGIYFLILRAPGQQEIGKMLLIR